jgi:hypothetical protein
MCVEVVNVLAEGMDVYVGGEGAHVEELWLYVEGVGVLERNVFVGVVDEYEDMDMKMDTNMDTDTDMGLGRVLLLEGRGFAF